VGYAFQSIFDGIPETCCIFKDFHPKCNAERQFRLLLCLIGIQAYSYSFHDFSSFLRRLSPPLGSIVTGFFSPV
jgi:hypothetical protein